VYYKSTAVKHHTKRTENLNSSFLLYKAHTADQNESL